MLAHSRAHVQHNMPHAANITNSKGSLENSAAATPQTSFYNHLKTDRLSKASHITPPQQVQKRAHVHHCMQSSPTLALLLTAISCSAIMQQPSLKHHHISFRKHEDDCQNAASAGAETCTCTPVLQHCMQSSPTAGPCSRIMRQPGLKIHNTIELEVPELLWKSARTMPPRQAQRRAYVQQGMQSS
jgi:hypothetical protein